MLARLPSMKIRNAIRLYIAYPSDVAFCMSEASDTFVNLVCPGYHATCINPINLSKHLDTVILVTCVTHHLFIHFLKPRYLQRTDPFLVVPRSRFHSNVYVDIRPNRRMKIVTQNVLIRTAALRPSLRKNIDNGQGFVVTVNRGQDVRDDSIVSSKTPCYSPSINNAFR